jgi:hypothetical protein
VIEPVEFSWTVSLGPASAGDEEPAGMPAPWLSVIDSMLMLAPDVARASAMWR